MPDVIRPPHPMFHVHDPHPLLHGLVVLVICALFVVAFVVSIMPGALGHSDAQARSEPPARVHG
jgi:hypothetical protein